MKAVSLHEAAERLACSVDTVRANIKAGRIHAVNLSLGTARKKLVVPESEIERLLSPPPPKAARLTRHRSTTTARRY
mgnify:CR=1 FL=1